MDNVKTYFQNRGDFGSRGRGRYSSGSWKPLKCYICGEPHEAIDCPQNPKRVMVAQEGEEEELLTEEVEAERGDNMMLRRTLISGNETNLESYWKRKSVF